MAGCGPEFWAVAVRPATSPGHTTSGVARGLGVSCEALRRHVRRAAAGAGETAGLTSDEREELRTLRRRVRTLEEERAIPARAAALLAKETGRTR